MTYDPERRITAIDGVQHEYFKQEPLPVPPSMFPTWPAKSEMPRRTHGNSPKPPSGGKAYANLLVNINLNEYLCSLRANLNENITELSGFKTGGNGLIICKFDEFSEAILTAKWVKPSFPSLYCKLMESQGKSWTPLCIHPV